MSKLFVCIFIMMITTPLTAETELKGHPDELKSFIHPDKKTVTITGTEKEKAYSDKAIVSLVITTEKKKLAVALQANSELRAKISSVLISTGLTQDNIKTSKFSTSPQFGWFSDKPNSYEVVNRMAISIIDEAHLNAIAKISDEYDEISLTGTEFEHTLKSKVEAKLKKNALLKVMNQKTFYEKSLDLKLKAVSFYDSDVVSAGTRGAQDLEERIVVTGSRTKISSYESNRAEVVKQTFDEVEYSVTISVQFEIVSVK